MLFGLDGVEIGIIIVFVTLFGAILSGFPVAFAIGGAGVIAFAIRVRVIAFAIIGLGLGLLYLRWGCVRVMVQNNLQIWLGFSAALVRRQRLRAQARYLHSNLATINNKGKKQM